MKVWKTERDRGKATSETELKHWYSPSSLLRPVSPFPLDFPGRLLRVYTHLGTHLRGHTATKVKLRLLHSSPPLCVSLAYIIQLPVRLAYSPKQTNGYQLDFMITRPFRYFSFRPFFFFPFSASSPFPIPLSVRAPEILAWFRTVWREVRKWMGEDSFPSSSSYVYFRGSWIDRGLPVLEGKF